MRRELGSVAIDATTSRRARAEVEGAPEPGATATQRTEPRRAASGLSGADAPRRGSGADAETGAPRARARVVYYVNFITV